MQSILGFPFMHFFGEQAAVLMTANSLFSLYKRQCNGSSATAVPMIIANYNCTKYNKKLLKSTEKNAYQMSKVLCKRTWRLTVREVQGLGSWKFWNRWFCFKKTWMPNKTNQIKNSVSAFNEWVSVLCFLRLVKNCVAVLESTFQVQPFHIFVI